MVKMAQASGRRPREIAEEFGISPDSVLHRVKQADLDEGRRLDGLTTSERQELAKRRRLGRAHLGRNMEDQPAQTALTANLRHPDDVQILCRTLDQLPQALAQLDGQTSGRPPRLQRSNRKEQLRRRNRAWAMQTQSHPPLNPEDSPPIGHEQRVAN